MSRERTLSSSPDTDRVLSQIAEQASTGTPITPSEEGWIEALPQLDDVACKFEMMDSLCTSYLWSEDGEFYAADLGPGLEDREGRPLNRNEALALLQGGVRHRPVPLVEVLEQ